MSPVRFRSLAPSSARTLPPSAFPSDGSLRTLPAVPWGVAMRWGILGVVAAMAAILSATAMAQGNDENWTKCKDDNPDIIFVGCTAVIQSGKEEKSNLAIAYYYRGGAYDSRGFYDRAIQDYDQAINLYPKYARAYNKRGYAYWATLKIDRAIQDFDQAITLDPKFALAFNNRGNA